MHDCLCVSFSIRSSYCLFCFILIYFQTYLINLLFIGNGNKSDPNQHVFFWLWFCLMSLHLSGSVLADALVTSWPTTRLCVSQWAGAILSDASVMCRGHFAPTCWSYPFHSSLFCSFESFWWPSIILLLPILGLRCSSNVSQSACNNLCLVFTVLDK